VQEQAVADGVAARSGEPWYDDACAALAAEEAGSYASDEELRSLVRRELPFYFARYGERERAYADSIDEVPNGDALRLFNQEILKRFDLRPDLALVDAETLVLTGADDFITGPACAEEIADGIAGAETVLIPDAGHFVFVEAPERFRAEVVAFLDGTG
jgi:pimeloyl-ACP methyl ester carboxylesterase